ncbi:MAG: hypothetical protein OXG70_03865 [Cyanobacteria bacterium MAG IRC1_bin_28]|nr:hypothetical protein [Cyanobacteria bacterium MAG IRC1_bin_28]
MQRELFFAPLLKALAYPYAPRVQLVLMGGEPAKCRCWGCQIDDP